MNILFEDLEVRMSPLDSAIKAVIPEETFWSTADEVDDPLQITYEVGATLRTIDIKQLSKAKKI